MQSPSDAELLAEWTTRRSEAAFARLVERYVALVHSAARRQVNDPHLAEEVTQAVFILLARKAAGLGRQTVLGGWLCRAAHFVARDALRTERRRQHREQLAATMDTSPDAAWQQLAPLLDEAVAQLREADRNAIVLRYYEQRTLDEVGNALGIGADAAQKRATRALEKLRGNFTKRGVTLTGVAIAGAVSGNAVQAVPLGLVAKISAAAFVAGRALTATTAVVMTTLQKTIIGATLAAAVGAGIYEARQAANARAEVQTLKQQQSPLAEQIEQLSQELTSATSQIAALREDNERLNQNSVELLRLRGEMGRFRGQSAELDGLRKENLRLREVAEQRRIIEGKTNLDSLVKQIVVSRVGQPRFVPESVIQTNISLRVGHLFSRTAADLDVQNILATGCFYQARVVERTRQDGVIVYYAVQERPKVTKVGLTGNTKFTDADLCKLLLTKVGQPLDDATVTSDAKAIEQLYATSGHSEMRVKRVSHLQED